MKQPIITRDLERKAIYTNILYDPEWLYISINVGCGSSDKGGNFHLNLEDSTYDFVIDWGDGCIEKNVNDHRYDKRGINTVRIKGYINFIEEPHNIHRLLGPKGCV